MKPRNEPIVDILRHARHFLANGRYVDSLLYRRTHYICHAIDRVWEYMALNYPQTHYVQAKEVIQCRIGRGNTLWSYLVEDGKRRAPPGLSPMDWVEQSPAWTAMRDDWLDALIKELEEEK